MIFLFLGDDLRKKWKNLRDNYAKYLRSEKTHTGQERKNICRYKTWPWARQMEPFRPFIGFAKTHSNITDIPLDVGENTTANEAETSSTQEVSSPVTVDPTSVRQDEETTETPHAAGSSGIKKRRVAANPPSTGVDKIINYLEKQSCRTAQHEERDEIDKLFQGYAASVKKLAPRRQTVIKYRIAQLIMEAELEQMDSEDSFATSSNSNSNSGTLQYSNNLNPVKQADFSSPPSVTQEDYSNPPSVPQTESSRSVQSWYENFGDHMNTNEF